MKCTRQMGPTVGIGPYYICHIIYDIFMTFSQNIICHKVPESKTCCQIHSFDATKMLCTKKLIPECPRETEGAFNTTCAMIRV